MSTSVPGHSVTQEAPVTSHPAPGGERAEENGHNNNNNGENVKTHQNNNDQQHQSAGTDH